MNINSILNYWQKLKNFASSVAYNIADLLGD